MLNLPAFLQEKVPLKAGLLRGTAVLEAQPHTQLCRQQPLAAGKLQPDAEDGAHGAARGEQGMLPRHLELEIRKTPFCSVKNLKVHCPGLSTLQSPFLILQRSPARLSCSMGLRSQ